MKAIIKIFILLLALNAVTWITPQKASAQVSVSFQVFYDDLSPYGYWVDNSDYGYVWVPDVPYGFTPYGSNGYWVFTDAGWTWVSNYSWGWAPFHYGRWYNDPFYGFMWVPGNEWGPGWVTWRMSEGYYGWAPIGPGISMDFAYSSGYDLPYHQWIFVNGGDMGRTDINNYYVNTTNNMTIINNSTVINNHRVDNSGNVNYNTGPDRKDVEKQTGKSITPVTIKDNNKPGQSMSNGELQTYRPDVEKRNSAGKKPVPSKVTSLKDVKTVADRNKTDKPDRKQLQDQTIKKQPFMEQPANKSVNKQPSENKNTVQPNEQQRPSKNQNTVQPNDRQQPSKKQNTVQPNDRQQPSKKQNTVQPNERQQPSKKQNTVQPNERQKPSKNQSAVQPNEQWLPSENSKSFGKPSRKIQFLQ